MHGELVDDFNQFFAPVATDLFSSMVAGYDAQCAKIDAFLDQYKSADLCGVISYFCQQRGETMPSFSRDKAIRALNSEYWSRALSMTDVYEAMPQKRRDAWYEQMNAWREPHYRQGENPELDLPDFTEETVRSTLGALLADRSQFFAEKVDGIFRALSNEHVTNCPAGYSKRMIIGYILSYGSPDYKRSGYINDLRCVIAKFMGRDAPGSRDTEAVVRIASQTPGKWVNVDGGALRIRVYSGVGTAHLEVHPEMAWRLNAVLASLYPAAIPESFRRKPVKAKKIKDFVLMDKPLPFAVISFLQNLKQARTLCEERGHRRDNYTDIKNALDIGYGDYDKHVVREAEAVLAAVGGVKMTKSKIGTYYQFDYHPRDVINEIICSGCIPDQKSHQYYPTPERLAKKLIEIAEIEDHHQCVEPSAGTGGIADFVPDHVYLDCYEISELHCKVLESKGYARTGTKSARCADFLKIAADYRGGGYDRVLMNPPFSDGRWKAHTEAAGKVLKRNGSVIAILPFGAKSSLEMPGFDMKWYGPFQNEFAGTAISVVILRADKSMRSN